MVTRVDKKPIIHNTTLIRALRPSVVSEKRKVAQLLLSKAVSHAVPQVSPRELVNTYDDVQHGIRLFGSDDPYSSLACAIPDEEDNDAIRIARSMCKNSQTLRQALRDESLMGVATKVQSLITKDVDKIYYGTEAIYQLFHRCLSGYIFETTAQPNYSKWVTDAAKSILMTQSTYMFMHPTAVHALTSEMARDTSYHVWCAWDMFKKTETMALKIISRKSFLAHAFHSGTLRKQFEPSHNIEDDFELPLTGYAGVKDGVKAHILLGLKYFKVGGIMCVLSHDDCVNLATMAQCYFRSILYFHPANGYSAQHMRSSTAVLADMIAHCCTLTDAKKNFADFIRSIHILAQKEFNDAFEETNGTGYGWEERSLNYDKEAKALDPTCLVYYEKCTSLALNRLDRLNTCFMYHVMIGDEMIATDLVSKVKEMKTKVRSADCDEWSRFIKFCKAYMLCRFMFVYKRKPKAGGELDLLNSSWAESCTAGHFRMPPAADWGKVWIKGEYRYTEFADTWHLECQDVSYVMKDSEGTINKHYSRHKETHSELLMAMKHGNTLDPLTGSTSRSARERICKGEAAREVVLTCAPKAENAKPTWKKRVTFAADCEFRKMQAEVDRNCRRTMSFVRGPSLGVDQCILEKQFADIASTTVMSTGGVICSHDISAWSESMDRARKFEFESVLLNMFDKPDMINIARDWDKIKAVINKQGCKEVIPIENGSFQGFDGSSSTILHSLILIYCLDTARRDKIIGSDIKTNMATLIDDCVALMVNLYKTKEAMNFWDHLKGMYLKLGFEVDDLKSIFSDIKAIYLSRRFLLGGEVPSDYKIFVKAHSSYEDPLRNTVDLIQDIFGGLRGAADANGDAWFIYFSACLSILAELAHAHNDLMQLPPAAAAVFALAPVSENGWGFPSLVAWSTNDVVDKMMHFNAMIEGNAVHMCQPASFTRHIDVMPVVAVKAVTAIKSQSWREVTYANIFTSPFEAMRDGPIKPDMIKRNAVQDILAEHATAAPWDSLLGWNRNKTTKRVRELLIQSGTLHAPTIAALVNCMPDNYRLSLIGKAIGSKSVFELLPSSERMLLKRRVHRAAANYFSFSVSLYKSSNTLMSCNDYAALTHTERTTMEREEFYACNGVKMSDHTFPDPVSSFTVTDQSTGCEICPTEKGLREFDQLAAAPAKASHWLSVRGIYVPRRSGRVWEVTCEHAKGWDTVSQRIAMGLAIIARAKADGHGTDGLLSYFVKAWNEFSTITPEVANLISIHGSIKRLDANPGSATHPITINRNLLSGFHNNLKPALDAVATKCKADTGSAAHLHDLLAHDSSMLAITALMFTIFFKIGVNTTALKYKMAMRKSAIIAESQERMTTDSVKDLIDLEIMDGEDDYGLLQACPSLIEDVGVPTMASTWVSMINALLGRDLPAIEKLRKEMTAKSMEEVIVDLKNKQVAYSPAVIFAAPPTDRHNVTDLDLRQLTMIPSKDSARTLGDSYTRAIKPISSKFTRELIHDRPHEAIVAILIRSIIWDRLKESSINSLAKILYSDPDRDLGVISRCSREDFWRAIVSEAVKHAKTATLSDLLMSAFRSLGVRGIHIDQSNDVKAVTHSVASFFGAHLPEVCHIISDRITQFSGRASRDFDRPLAERFACYNPGVTNARLKQQHMKKLIATVLGGYRDRIKSIHDGKVTHRGDKRACEVDAGARVDDLFARCVVYENTQVYNKGELIKHWSRMVAAAISEAATRVEMTPEAVGLIGNRLNLIPSDFEDKSRIDDNRPKRANTRVSGEDFLACFDSISVFCRSSNLRDPWDVSACKGGASVAISNLDHDAGNVQNTTFAVSPAEFAPKLFKRIIVTDPGLPIDFAMPTEKEEVEDTWFGDETDDLESLLAGDIISAGRALDIEAWKALYALIIHGRYQAKDVNSKLGTSLPDDVTCSALREAHLDDFADSTIFEKFPDVAADYLVGGLIFDPDWLNRDEADAYTTDELHTASASFLF